MDTRKDTTLAKRSALGPKLLALLLSTSCALLLCEWTLRRLHPELAWRPFPDTYLGWSNNEVREFDPHLRQPGKQRILFLGDSFMAGVGVAKKRERLPNVLGELLGESVDVRVLATAGWGTDQEYLAFLQKGAAWEPHLVVLSFCANNDLSNILSNRHPSSRDKPMRKPYFILDEQGPLALHDFDGRPLELDPGAAARAHSFQSSLLALLRYHLSGTASEPSRDAIPSGDHAVDSRYTRFPSAAGSMRAVHELKHKLNWSPQSAITDVAAFIREDFPDNQYQWRVFEALVARLDSSVKSAGGRLILMPVPSALDASNPNTIVGASLTHEFNTPSGDFSIAMDEPNRRLAAIAERLEIAYLDSCAAFAQHVRSGRLMAEFWPKAPDRHFSAPAHRLLAERARDFVQPLLGQ